jgi:hypothetical protein
LTFSDIGPIVARYFLARLGRMFDGADDPNSLRPCDDGPNYSALAAEGADGMSVGQLVRLHEQRMDSPTE